MSSVDPRTYDVDPGKGWVVFAACMLGLVGVLNVIYGIGAISDSKVYVKDATYVFANLHTWGWLMLIVGVAQVVTGFGVWGNYEWARWLGVLFAAANMIIQFLAMPANTGIALALFFVDVIILYALLTYGGADRDNAGRLELTGAVGVRGHPRERRGLAGGRG